MLSRVEPVGSAHRLDHDLLECFEGAPRIRCCDGHAL